MAKFCGSCGAQLSDTSAFCVQCGTAQNVAAAPPVQPPVPEQPAYSQVNVPPPAQPSYAPLSAPAPVQYAPVNPPGGAPPSYPPAPVAKGSGSGLKIVLGILAVLFVGALLVLGGVFYVGHRVVNKIKSTAAENGLSFPSDSNSESAAVAFHGDPCSLLSKDDVSAAIGIPIVATQSNSDGCSYLAQGTSSDMTAKHLSAMMGTKGADHQTEDTIHKLAGGLLGAQQGESKEQTQDANGSVPVVVFSIDTNSARTQMKLNSKILGGLGPSSGSGPISGIGDEAFDAAGGMMLVRKGEKLIRITYLMCPCTTEAIKPLARKLAGAI